MLSPVIIFVYNRPEHTKRTIQALAENYLASETEVFIFADAPKNEKAIEKVELVREYIDTLPNKKYFKSIKIHKSESNLGLANSIIGGVSKIIEEYGKVIVVEDDLVTSKDFLKFMNGALEKYETNQRIWSISGYNIPIEIPSYYKSDIYLSYRGCSWGWATWVDRWRDVDWEVSDYDNFIKNKSLKKKFNRGGRGLVNMLEAQMKGNIDSWAIRWCYTQSKFDKLTVYPVISRINNIGLDGSGTHSGKTNRYESPLNTEFEKCEFNDPGLNGEILKDFHRHYMSSMNYYKLISKNIIKRILRM